MKRRSFVDIERNFYDRDFRRAVRVILRISRFEQFKQIRARDKTFVRSV